jgi:hypothetical protein
MVLLLRASCCFPDEKKTHCIPPPDAGQPCQDSSVSILRTLLPVSTDVEFDSCGICVVSPLHLSVYFGKD